MKSIARSTRLPNKFEVPGTLTHSSLALPEGLNFDEWQAVGETLARVEGSVAWWIGDWYSYGDRRYGEKAAAANVIGESGGLDPRAVQQYSYVCARYEFASRLANLSFGHHQSVAFLDDRHEWLARAEKENWTRAELRREVAAAKLLAAKQAGVAQAEYPPLIRKITADQLFDSLPDESVDLLLTDPPYMTDVPDIREFAADWLPKALAKVRSTGRAYICCGAYPEELHAYLSVLFSECPVVRERFVVADVLVWTYRNTLGPTPEFTYKTNWQAILHLYGSKATRLDCPVMVEQFSVQDINAPDGRQENRLHAWQKPDELAERLIRHSTKPGDLVVDPFAGTGTFLLAAARLGRQSLGSEKDSEMFELALRCGCKTQ